VRLDGVKEGSDHVTRKRGVHRVVARRLPLRSRGPKDQRIRQPQGRAPRETTDALADLVSALDVHL
jgi:hypothetical protein